MREARTAGTNVAMTATPSATPVTRPTVDAVSGTGAGLPMKAGVRDR